MTFWSYILRCSDGSYYTGHTDNLDLRIALHQHGEIEGYTQKRRPVELVWARDCGSRIEALEAERRIKGWSRVKKEALIQGDWAAIQRLASRSVVLRDAPSLRSVAPQDERSVGVSVRPEEGLSVSEGPSQRASLPPIIVLVRPQLGENIGKAARAMLNFGLSELRLVAPRDGWPNPDAGPAAAGADQVLSGASVYATTAEAIADCTYVYATTVRKRGVTKPVVTPQQAAAEIVVGPGRTAILFGAERSGLETDDVAAAQSIITVPINPAFGSLNLAQAVILVAYEWSKHSAALVQPPMEQAEPPAPQAELEDMIQSVFAMLEERNYFYPPERTHATQLALRNLLTQGRWNSGQVRTMRGVFSAFQKDRQRGKRG